MRPLFVLAATLALAAPPASAATWTVNVTGPMQLGTLVAAAAGETVFRISSADGSVSVVSGGGYRLTAGSARTTVEVSCRPAGASDDACRTTEVPLRIGTIANIRGRARPFAAFNITMGTAALRAGPTGANPLEFTLDPVGDHNPRTFFLGGDYPVSGDDASSLSGPAENHFFVFMLGPNGGSVASDGDDGEATVYRSLSVGKTSDLTFGRIQLPTSGSSTVTLHADSGNRTSSGDAVAYPTPAPTRAAFTIAGEGGQQVSVTIPTTIQLSGPGELTVILDDDAPHAPRLTGGRGQRGTFSFHVGGSITLTPATPTGAYTGTVPVMVDYN